ncbi:MAG: stage III sporulation protein AF [Firmicutes bacterium]|nr:stage III sporulation protein AF [Bacillota bacterium]
MLLQTICKIGTFMICAQAIIHFRPRETYEKYLKLLVGVMILIQLFLPVGSFLLGGGMEQTLKSLELFRTQLEQELENAAGEAEAADKLLEQMTLEEVRKRVEEQRHTEEEALEEAGEVEEVPEVTVIVGPIEIQ